MNNVFFDEAGNTGTNLSDEQQPIFCLATNCYSDDEARELLKGFNQMQSEELHFKKLRKTNSGRRKIIDLLNHELIVPSKIDYYVSDKRFCITALIIDLILEPIYRKLNYDLYKDGYSLCLANWLHYNGMKNFNEFNSLQNTVIHLFRKENVDSSDIDDFLFKIELLKNLINDRTLNDYFFRPIINSKHLLSNLFYCHDKYQLDVTLGSFTWLVNSWGNKLGKKFNVYHDESKQIEYYKEFILFTTEIPTKSVGYINKEIHFPLKINELMLIDSKASLGIQISDIIASSIYYLFKKKYVEKNDDEFAEQIFNSKLAEIPHGTMLYKPNFTPDLLGKRGSSNDVINYLVEQQIEHERKHIR